ncbi:rod shape-determining protein MreD [Algiphilus sp.]|uniref:rod shape-determining protein MreD n=1 Tax=Algiphilus sp. TaxID=1872431 RepID=UPI001CA733E1|nr:rod shape-determining protein MreD [Algiphilus sp.]MBY8966215.1 rod shape-determining protein MreD [Algiphilus acroporae]MCI5061617.1 rod shape-determining protein MreD [Algiphilus sp.]MCI5104575.1 rod shape-determining protein MreD [Algiphilus sp.]
MIWWRELPLLVALTLIALVLKLLPVPLPVDALRPHWLLLVLTAWTLRRETYLVLPMAMASGLVLDATRGVTLGLHCVALLVPLALMLHWRSLLRAIPLWQSTLVAAALFAVYAGLLSLLDTMTGEHSQLSAHWWPILFSVPLWPIFVLLLRPRPVAQQTA